MLVHLATVYFKLAPSGERLRNDLFCVKWDVKFKLDDQGHWSKFKVAGGKRAARQLLR